MTYRIRNIVIAVGLALVAMLLTLLYVTNVKRSVQTKGETAHVYVVSRDVPAGTSGAEIAKSDLKLVAVQRADVVPGAISSPAQVDSLVLSAPLYQGEQVTLRRFSDAAAEGIRSQLGGTARAVQLSGDADQVLAGTLQAGDHVDLVANLHQTASDGSTDNATRIVLRDLDVLSTGDATKLSTAAPGTSSVILAVSDTQVQRLFFVLRNADWTLELRPVENAADSPDRIETVDSVLTGRVK